MLNRNLVSIKDLNKRNILKIVLKKGPITRTEISNLLKISRPTSASYIKELMEDGFIIEKGKNTPTSSGGKKAALLQFNNNAKFIIGLRIGERTLKIAITDLSSNIIEIMKISTEEWNGPESVIKKIVNSIKKILAKTKIPIDKILGIGIACTGLVDGKNGVVIFSPNLKGWKNIELAKIIEAETNITTLIENDVRIQAIAEKNHGLAKGIGNFICFTTGIGIGTGIVIDNRLIIGKNGISGEIGHLIIDITSKERCHCGNIGCLETLSNSTALIKNIKRTLKKKELSLFNLSENFRIEDLYKLYKSNEQAIVENVNMNAFYIGLGISNSIKFFTPDLIIIQGKYVGFGQKYLNIIKETVKKYTFPEVPFDYEIRLSQLGDNVGLIGATSLVFEEAFLNTFEDLANEYMLKKI